jgi:hypothetical protein
MATGVFTQASQSNTYIKDHAATGRMVVGYSRNIKSFGINRFVQFKKVTKDKGYFLEVNQFNAARIVASNLNEYVWPDGQPRPVLNNNGIEFRYRDYETIRRNFGQNTGKKASDQADFDLIGLTEDELSFKAMLSRSIQVYATLGLAGNWDIGHRVDVTTIPGSGQWSAALGTAPFIQNAINFGCNRILLDTIGKVKKEDLILNFNPNTANRISSTQEIRDHVKQSPVAIEQVKGTGNFSQWGLPNQLYGVNLNVDDTVKVTSPRGATNVVTDFACPDGVAYLTSRVGGLEAPKGGPSFSSVTCFCYEEMTVERKYDPDDRLSKNNVVDDVVALMTAPASCFAFLNLYS